MMTGVFGLIINTLNHTQQRRHIRVSAVNDHPISLIRKTREYRHHYHKLTQLKFAIKQCLFSQLINDQFVKLQK